jgi:hypothetical protein
MFIIHAVRNFDTFQRRDLSGVWKNGMNAAFKYHLGGGIFVSSSGADVPLIHIRRHFLPEGVMFDIPTKKGIAMRMKEWYTILRQQGGIKQRSLEIAQAIPCFVNHPDVEYALGCQECNPFGFPILTLSS